MADAAASAVLAACPRKLILGGLAVDESVASREKKFQGLPFEPPPPPCIAGHRWKMREDPSRNGGVPPQSESLWSQSGHQICYCYNFLRPRLTLTKHWNGGWFTDLLKCKYIFREGDRTQVRIG